MKGANGELLGSGHRKANFEVTQSQPVTIEVSGQRADDTYTLVATTFQDDHGSSEASATQVELGITVPGLLELEGDKDVFQFNAVAGVEYAIGVDVAGDPSLGPTATVEGKDGQSFYFASSNGFVVQSEISQTLTITVESTVEYRPEKYSVTVEEFSKADDFGGSPEEAYPLSVGETIKGTISGLGDSDWFVLETTSYTSYEFEYSNSETIFIYGEDGKSRISQRQWTPILQHIGDNERIYVRLENGLKTDYEFSVREIPDDHSNAYAAPTSVAIGESLTGEISYTSDSDIFAVDAEAGQAIRVLLENVTLDRHGLHILDPTGNSISLSFGSTITEAETIEVEESGTYLIEVTNDWTELGT